MTLDLRSEKSQVKHECPSSNKIPNGFLVHLYRGQGHKVVKVTKSLTFRFNESVSLVE